MRHRTAPCDTIRALRTKELRDRRGRRRSAKPDGRIQQLPWRQVVNTHGTLSLLDPEGVQKIHDASIRVLEELGIELWSASARKLFADAGAIVDGETVRVGREIEVTEALQVLHSCRRLDAAIESLQYREPVFHEPHLVTEHGLILAAPVNLP